MNLKLHEKRIPYLFLFLSLLIALLGSFCFFGFRLYAILIALPFSFFCVEGLTRMKRQRESIRARKNLTEFLHFLCSNMSVGLSLRHCFSMAADGFAARHSEKNLLKKALRKIASALETQQNLGECVDILIKALPCPETEALLYALRMEHQLGSRLLDVLRDSAEIARELLIIQEEVSAANARSRAEGMILCAVPFFMVPFFGNLLHDAFSATAHGQILLMKSLAYIIAMIAIILQLRLGGSAVKKLNSPPSSKAYRRAMSQSQAWAIIRNLLHRLPLAWADRLHKFYLWQDMEKLLTVPNPVPTGKSPAEASFSKELLAWHIQIQCQKFLISSVFFLSIMFIAGQSVIWGFLLALLFSIYSTVQLITFAQEQEKVIRQSLPFFLALLLQLLRNNMSLEAAINKCEELWRGQAPAMSSLLKSMVKSMDVHIPADVLLRRLGSLLKLSESTSALILLSRYSSLGGADLLLLLDKQIQLCWTEQRAASRRSLETRSALTMLPMMLDLISVIIIGAAPAMVMFAAF